MMDLIRVTKRKILSKFCLQQSESTRTLSTAYKILDGDTPLPSLHCLHLTRINIQYLRNTTSNHQYQAALQGFRY